jgi:hypothetical protein
MPFQNPNKTPHQLFHPYISESAMGNYLIIGGSSGIGQALANQLTQAENQVFASYHKTEPPLVRPQLQLFLTGFWLL